MNKKPSLWTLIGVGQSPRFNLYRCVCGTKREVSIHSIMSGKSVCCGCINKGRTTHGMKGTPEYEAWQGMKSRCSNPNRKGHYKWGGRGIKVCERWLGKTGFANFFADMGPRPTPKHSIDQINNDGDYEPKNCRWATIKQQSRNRRSTVFVEFRGERRCFEEWGEVTGIPHATIRTRLVVLGWSVEDALTIPVVFGQKVKIHKANRCQ